MLLMTVDTFEILRGPKVALAKGGHPLQELRVSHQAWVPGVDSAFWGPFPVSSPLALCKKCSGAEVKIRDRVYLFLQPPPVTFKKGGGPGP